MEGLKIRGELGEAEVRDSGHQEPPQKKVGWYLFCIPFLSFLVVEDIPFDLFGI